jgi:hypothetical protein
MTCGRCHEPIRPGEPYDRHIPDSGTAPTVYLHVRICKKVPHQATPIPR